MSERDAPRVVRPVRNQLSLQSTDLEALVPDDHPVRAIWALTERLELSEFYDEIEARGSAPGRPATDPQVLLALWLFANSEGVGSARLLERLCERDAPYRWICGGVPVNHHTLSDFRVKQGKKLDRLLTQTLAALMKQGVLQLKRVAQDGMKVRAHAGAGSFKRKSSLERAHMEAEQQVRRLKRELADDPGAGNRRVQAAKERAARARQEAVEAALRELPMIEEKREEQAKKNHKRVEKKEVRASKTDAECRVMKMADGSFRPAYNVQLATDAGTGCIVGVDVTNNGTDQPHVVPMLDDIAARTGQTPQEYLVDGGFVTHENIEAVTERGATIYAPPAKSRNPTIDPCEPKKDDPPAVAAWRLRMKTVDALGRPDPESFRGFHDAPDLRHSRAEPAIPRGS